MASLAYLTYPYFCSSSIIYIINQKRILSHFQILFGIGLFALGYFIFLYSNGIKGKFRKDPNGAHVKRKYIFSSKFVSY